MASKIARIVDFCGKSSGLADFEKTVDRGSAAIFGADSGLCLSYVRILGPKRNLDHRSFFSLGRNVTEVRPNYFLFRKKLLLLELQCVIVIKYAVFFTIWTKLTVAFTCTNLLLNLYTSVSGCICGFGFDQKFWRIDGFGAKKGTDWRICIPLFTPLHDRSLGLYEFYLRELMVSLTSEREIPIISTNR